MIYRAWYEWLIHVWFYWLVLNMIMMIINIALITIIFFCEGLNFIIRFYRHLTGHVITFDPNRGQFKTNDRSRLYSPMMSPSNDPRCLTYYYHMSNQNVDHMGFYMRNFNEPLPLDPVLSVFGKQPWGWHEQKYTIDPSDQYFQVGKLRYNWY